ncbi:hypothetical protein KIN34_14320 [Cellulomonas sp. DKR-3]|uniref:Uncharacterized protein n=1 Tax=Cellulomonas fulva TaxID=2835530 RepID=A0ABS5U234_9CELL|nr:hypothetical protein [Cellulomonas fulva]MBT0995459.1 hypothetical protein [Cellulomonas fulva]
MLADCDPHDSVYVCVDIEPITMHEIREISTENGVQLVVYEPYDTLA